MKQSTSSIAAFFVCVYVAVMYSFTHKAVSSDCALKTADDWKSWMSSFDKGSSRSGAGKTNFKHEDFQNAWYIADEGKTMEEYEQTYASEYRHLLKDPKFIPFKPDSTGPGGLIGMGDDPVLTGVRPLNKSTYNYFHPVCHQYRFPDLSLFPTVSVVMPVQNEHTGLLSMTIHSILARTPPQLLKQIIISDDNVDHRHEASSKEIEHLLSLSPKIEYVTHDAPLGCAGSRLEAAEKATGDVLVVVDSHVEMYSNDWLQHLLLPILENPSTLSMQALDIIDDLPGHKRVGSGGHQYGIISDVFIFGYVAGRFGTRGRGGRNVEETPTNRLPYESPFVPGSLFAIRRDEFWRLGGYDKGLAVWGGENTELALKIWLCGFGRSAAPGRAVIIPCSRVGHVYRIHMQKTGKWPPPLPNATINGLDLRRPGKWQLRDGGRVNDFERIVIKNNLRILYVWGNNATMSGYLDTKFGVKTAAELPSEWRPFVTDLPTDPHIQEQLKIREQNQCKDFDWFDRNIYYKQLGRHHPWHPTTYKGTICGSHRAYSCGECPAGNGPTWCNGDCTWCKYGAIDDAFDLDVSGALGDSSKCVKRGSKCRQKADLKLPTLPKSGKPVKCGQHSAASCAECSQGNGEGWCNGVCHWCPHGAEGGPIVWADGTGRKDLHHFYQCVPRADQCRDTIPAADQVKK